MALEACDSDRSQALPPDLVIIVTPLRLHEWKEGLQAHPDQIFADYILRGIDQGFRIASR